MFVLQRLSQLIQSAAPSSGSRSDLVQLSSGQFWTAEASSTPSWIEQLHDAIVTVRSTSTPFQYQLVVAPVPSDEAALNDLEQESEFLIDQSLQFYRIAQPYLALRWRDPTDQRMYEYRVDSQAVNKHTFEFFETTVLECMFERRFQKPRDMATMNDLELLKYQPTAEPKASTSSAEPQSDVKVTMDLPKNALVTVTAELFLYEPSSSQFILQLKDAQASLHEINPFRFVLSVTGNGKSILSQPVESHMHPVFNNEYHSFIWVFHDGNRFRILMNSGVVEVNNLAYSWSLKFNTTSQDESLFRDVFGRCMYETLNRERFEKVKKEDQKYLVDAYAEDVEMEDAFEEENESESESETEEEEEDQKGGKRLSMGGSGSDKKNSLLTVGFKDHRSYVVRGDRLGVFKYGDDDLEFATSINNISTPSGDLFSPQKVMLHDQDSSMIMMNAKDPNSLYRMDLEYGKVVDEWKIDEDRELTDFTSDTKYGQMTPQKTFVGLSHNAVFRIDPRLAGNKLVQDQMNQYQSKNEFSCTTTTGTGDLIVASNKGDIRLYNQIDKRAKTHLPGLGDPIIGVDVTDDGKFILSTCKNYLLVVETEANTGDAVVSGYKKSLGAKKPAPKRLQLKPEHIAWMNMTIQFTPARFNIGDDMERTIVTTTGPYVITWNFRRVKAGRLYDYTIKKYPTTVVAGRFGFGNDKNVIVALPDDVTLANKKSFMSPQKAFASPSSSKTPVKNLRSRSSIVNSPF